MPMSRSSENGSAPRVSRKIRIELHVTRSEASFGRRHAVCYGQPASRAKLIGLCNALAPESYCPGCRQKPRGSPSCVISRRKSWHRNASVVVSIASASVPIANPSDGPMRNAITCANNGWRSRRQQQGGFCGIAFSLCPTQRSPVSNRSSTSVGPLGPTVTNLACPSGCNRPASGPGTTR